MATSVLIGVGGGVVVGEDSDEGEVSSSEEEVNLEEGEVQEEQQKKNESKNNNKSLELEEGEVSDEGQDNKPICRFFGKGLCTWGNNCRFLHPGVPDKGLYTMFEPKARPPPPAVVILPPAPQQQIQQPTNAPIKTGLLGHAPPNYPQTPYHQQQPLGPESAWERGLRHAKEAIKASVKRKETDVDFEEKKMNLSLAQDEIDKENDYYVVRKPEPPQLTFENKQSDSETEEAENLRLLQQQRAINKIDPDFVRNRVHRIHHQKKTVRSAPPLHETAPAHRNSTEDNSKKQNESTWHDPWMRANQLKKSRDSSASSSNWEDSPSRRRNSARSSSRDNKNNKKKRARSSDSSSSSDSDSESSNSSKSSFDDRKKRIRKAPPRDFPTTNQMRIAPPLPSNDDDFQHSNNSSRGRTRFRYAPPPQNNERFSSTRPHPQQHPQQQHPHPQQQQHPQQRFGRYGADRVSQQRRPASGPSQQRYYKRSKFSRDRSTSSSTSSNSSNNSKRRSPIKRSKRNESETDSDSSLDVLPTTTLKIIRTAPPQEKQQRKEEKKCHVKMTLTNKSVINKDNKNIVEKLDDDEEDITTPPTQNRHTEQRTSPDRDVLMKEKIMSNLEPPSVSKSRREELLKQLKAVEDAIAKKRSKIEAKH